jgi:hypothetical protein
MTAILGTATDDSSPRLELATPKGQMRWIFAYDPEGPVPIVVPKRKRKGEDVETDHIPTWVEEAARLWWSAIHRFETELTPRQDALRELDLTGNVLVTAFGKALLFDNPDLRKTITAFAQNMHRRSRQHGTPPDLAALLATRAGQLTDILRRTDPSKNLRSSGGTPETKAKALGGDHLDRLVAAADLSDFQRDAADAIAKVLRKLTKRLSIKTSDLEPEGRGKGGGVTQPVEGMSDEQIDYLQDVYMPWAQRMHAVPWHVDLWRAGHTGNQTARAAPNPRGGTYLTITRSQVFDGLLPAQSDHQYRIPDGRSTLILHWALSKYPRAPVPDFDDEFS